MATVVLMGFAVVCIVLGVLILMKSEYPHIGLLGILSLCVALACVITVVSINVALEQGQGRPIGIDNVPDGAYEVLAVAENDTTINALVVEKGKVVRAITLSSGNWRCRTFPGSVVYITTVGDGDSKKKIVTNASIY